MVLNIEQRLTIVDFRCFAFQSIVLAAGRFSLLKSQFVVPCSEINFLEFSNPKFQSSPWF
jgi:hypothetical protein